MAAIDLYSIELQQALRDKRSFSTYNKDLLHAAEIVIYGLFYAEKEVYLLSSKLISELYGDPRLHESLHRFLSKDNTKLHILVEQPLPLEHPIIVVARQFKHNMSLCQIRKEIVATYDFNFMLIDDFGYRFEYDRDEYTAIASFYESDQKDTCRMLKEFFLSLQNESSPVETGQEETRG